MLQEINENCLFIFLPPPPPLNWIPGDLVFVLYLSVCLSVCESAENTIKFNPAINLDQKQLLVH